MLSANELRCGNLIFGPLDEIMKIVLIDDTCCPPYLYAHCINDKGHGQNGFHPIPITEEWLLKFGFEKISENSSGKMFGYVINDVFSSDLSFVFWKTTNQAGKFFRHGLELKTVHQLQNLYFALTQKELELC